MRLSWERLAALAGIAYVVLFIVAFALGIEVGPSVLLPTAVGFLGFLVLIAWVLAVSAVLVVRPSPVPSPRTLSSDA